MGFFPYTPSTGCHLQSRKTIYFTALRPVGWEDDSGLFKSVKTNVGYSYWHKVRIDKECHSVCPLVGIGTLPTPLSPASVPLPPEPGGGGAHSPAGERVGESQFRRLKKKLSTLPTLWLLVFVGDI